jgi:hypothetical protein
MERRTDCCDVESRQLIRNTKAISSILAKGNLEKLQEKRPNQLGRDRESK